MGEKLVVVWSVNNKVYDFTILWLKKTEIGKKNLLPKKKKVFNINDDTPSLTLHRDFQKENIENRRIYASHFSGRTEGDTR